MSFPAFLRDGVRECFLHFQNHWKREGIVICSSSNDRVSFHVGCWPAERALRLPYTLTFFAVFHTIKPMDKKETTEMTQKHKRRKPFHEAHEKQHPEAIIKSLRLDAKQLGGDLFPES